MDGVFLDWINSAFGSGACTLIGVLCFVIPITAGISGFVATKLSKYKKSIKDQAIAEKEDDDFKEDIKNLVETVNQMKTHMEAMDDEQRKHNTLIDDKISKIQDTIASNEEASKVGDQELREEISLYKKQVDLINKKIDTTTENINLLIESDKESIKSYITTEYYVCREKKYIEIYILQTLENRYNKYLQENGNTFVAGLMDEMRKLPHEPLASDVIREKKQIMPKLPSNFLDEEN